MNAKSRLSYRLAGARRTLRRRGMVEAAGSVLGLAGLAASPLLPIDFHPASSTLHAVTAGVVGAWLGASLVRARRYLYPVTADGVPGIWFIGTGMVPWDGLQWAGVNRGGIVLSRQSRRPWVGVTVQASDADAALLVDALVASQGSLFLERRWPEIAHSAHLLDQVRRLCQVLVALALVVAFESQGTTSALLAGLAGFLGTRLLWRLAAWTLSRVGSEEVIRVP